MTAKAPVGWQHVQLFSCTAGRRVVAVVYNNCMVGKVLLIDGLIGRGRGGTDENRALSYVAARVGALSPDGTVNYWCHFHAVTAPSTRRESTQPRR